MNTLFRKGFTLIELLVVVLIIGILAAVALPQYQKAVAKTRIIPYASLLKALAQAEDAYYLTNGSYTNEISALDISIPPSCRTSSGKGLFRCENIGLLQLVSGEKQVIFVYCPNHNDGVWSKCGSVRDVTLYYTFGQHADGGKLRCDANNDSSVGQHVCASLGE